ncbi:benzoate-CoA ligase family protein [Bacillus aquiflavi]|uniref:benzoate-CoA ligase family protein n=1 Tax=Bacillus aquiflavi TaxID=2672567 RepID=UPI001CA9CFE2|nr:benzoate-CoA ligase family protein [Bacillus aquiflavi]UAC49833.1 benzoate-CoA ligase family protein [Bacillus aquiflavi]
MIDAVYQYKGLKQLYNAAHRFIEQNIQKGFGNKVAIDCDKEQVTYETLLLKVNQFGNALKNIGIEPESRLLLLTYDSPEFIISFFGAVKIGAVPIPVNTMMKPDDYEYFLNHSRAKVLVVHAELWEKIKLYRERFVFLKEVIVIEGDETVGAHFYHFDDLLHVASNELITEKTTLEDAAFWLYSSGSTGEPKGVVHLQRSMEKAFDNYARQVLNIDENDRTFSVSKLFFAYGLGNGMYFPLGAGGTTILLKDRPTPEKVFKTIADKKPTIFFGVPTHYGAMIHYVEKTGKIPDLSSVRVCVSAGESLPAIFVEKWKELFNIDILDGIGSTEALHIFLSNYSGDVKPGSSGKVVPGYDAKIVNDDFLQAATNEIGDLVIKGKSITAGYWCNTKETHRKFYGEWMYTGDKYYQDQDGYFWYCGRSDDMLKVGGIWVSPIEIETTLLQHDVVLEVAVIGIEDEHNLVYPKAFVVLKDGIEPTESLKNELKNDVKATLAPYKYPREIEFLPELPKTATGKVQRFRLRSK